MCLKLLNAFLHYSLYHGTEIGEILYTDSVNLTITFLCPNQQMVMNEIQETRYLGFNCCGTGHSGSESSWWLMTSGPHQNYEMNDNPAFMERSIVKMISHCQLFPLLNCPQIALLGFLVFAMCQVQLHGHIV